MLSTLFLDLHNFHDKQYFISVLSPILSTHNVQIQEITPDKLIRNKNECLLICDIPSHLKIYQNNGFFCIGYAPSLDFLPVSYCFQDVTSLTYSYFTTILSRYKKEPLSILDTSRLHIQELSEPNLADLYKIYQQPGMSDFITDAKENYSSFYQKKCAYIKQIYPFYDYGIWGIFLKDSTILIGECGIQSIMLEQKEEIEIGYLLSKSYQKKGYGTEMVTTILQYAKKQFSFSRIIARIAPENKASIALATKCGMTYEKTIYEQQNPKEIYVFHNP